MAWSNQTENTGTWTDMTLEGSSGALWDSLTDTWNSLVGTWDDGYGINWSNQSENTGTWTDQTPT